MELRKGQALVETAVTFPIILMVILAAFDPFFFSINLAVAKSWTFLAAREASIHEAGGGVSCQMRVATVPDDVMFMVENVSATVTPCPADVYWTPPSGSLVTAHVDFDYPARIWFGATWQGSMETKNIFR